MVAMVAMVRAWPANGEEYGQGVGLTTRLGYPTRLARQRGASWSLTSRPTAAGIGARAGLVATVAALPSVPSVPMGMAALAPRIFEITRDTSVRINLKGKATSISRARGSRALLVKLVDSIWKGAGIGPTRKLQKLEITL